MLTHIPEEGGGRLVLTDDATGREQGFLSYVLITPALVDAQHTVVHPDYQGLGLAVELAKAFFLLVQEQGWQVRPSCSYIARYLERHSELAELQEKH